MAGRTLFLGFLVLVALAPTPAPAQGIDTTNFVRGLYRDYLGRDPSPDETISWVRPFQRGTPPAEVHAFILACDECFDRYRRNAPAWINGAYQFVLRRPPLPRDLVYWGDRLDRYGGDRLKLARDFLRAADWQAPTFTSPAAVVPAGDLPTRLLTTCQLLASAVQAELPGDRGWLAQTQANNLLTSAQANRLVLADPPANPFGYRQAVDSLQAANDGLRTTLAQAGAAAPTARQYADQVYQILALLRQQAPPTFVGPPPPPPTEDPPVGGVDSPAAERYGRLVADLLTATQQFAFVLRSVPADWAVERLLRDAEDFQADIDRLRFQVRTGANLNDLRASAAALRQQADRLSVQLRRGTFDRRILQAWYDASLAFNKLAEGLGTPTPGLIDPWQPVPVTSPGGGHFPVNLGGPPTPPGPPPHVLRALDEAIAQCDVLATALTPYAFQSPVIPSVQSELRTLRNSLVELRRLAVQGAARTQVLTALNYAVEDARRVETLWNRMLASPGLPRDLPSLATLQRSVQQFSDPTHFGGQP